MEYRMLGPLDVLDEGSRVPLGGSKQRALLAVLLLHANEVVSVDRLVDELWGERPPGSAAKLVQGYVSALRRVLHAGAGGDGPLETQPPGYVLRVARDELDRFAFERLVGEARAADGRELAAGRLRDALGLWRGSALADVSLEGPGRQEAERLDERRLAVLVERIELDLELGRHRDVIGELEELVAAHPFHERLPALLILALYRSGRQAEALGAYRETRRRLVDELGLEPGPELQGLERQILAHDPALDLPAVPPAPAEPVPPPPPTPAPPLPATGEARRVRKMVTVLFSDVVEWSSLAERLDPEALHGVQARYHEEIAKVLVRHGGTVEKFIGDAAVAVFGVPLVHEDDALRAVRAAVEIGGAVEDLNHELEREWGVRLTVHTGVNTGEVVTGVVSAGHSLAAGDTVVVAARLQQAAGSGEVLLGPDTYRLVADAVRADPVEPLLLKGRTTPVAAWRLVELAAERPFLTEPAAPLVGRRRELAALDEAYERAIAERSCRLCTVVGPPGIGKSRLVREFAESREDAVVVVGRCLPYGEGITYWPLVDIVGQLLGADPQARIAELMGGEERGAEVANRVAVAVGRARPAGSPEEIAWAVRKLLERVAGERPLVVVVDDAHWAEPTLLDLLEYLLGFASGAPILLVCLARPDLLEQRPAWAAPRAETSLVPLEPLSEDEARALIGQITASSALTDEALARVVAAAEGNPLFLEQLHALHAQQGGAPASVPPSIHALLAARIDRLEPGERIVLECASIEGRTFHLGGLAALLPERLSGDLDAQLMALVRKEFVHADRANLAGEEAFRFRHLLIRDAAYSAIPMATRAQLHERFAAWVEERAPDRVELEDIVGYHLEQAFRSREALGGVDDSARALARRAATMLASAGQRASARFDVSAAVSLLGRAAALLPPDDADRLELLPDLGFLLTEAGQLARAEQVLVEARETAAATGATRAELAATIEFAALHLLSDPRSEIDALLDLVEQCIPGLEELGDDRGQSRAWYLIGLVRGLWAGRHAVAERALAQALDHARRSGDKRQELQILNRLAFVAWSGPTPLPQAIARCHEILASAGGDRALEAGALRWLAALEARAGRFDEARELVAASTERYDEIGWTLMAASMRAFGYGDVELLAGRPDAAELELRRGYETLAEMGEQGYRSTVAGFLARALYAQDRLDEAERFTRLSEETAAGEDMWSQVLFRATRAKVLARRGADGDARRLVTEMLSLVEETDLLDLRGDALLDAAEVLRLLGDAEAPAYVERALALYEQKGNVVSARRAAAFLEDAATPS